MDQYPQKTPQEVIQFIEFEERDKPEGEWSPIVVEMLNRYGTNSQFLYSLQGVLHSWTVSGSVLPLLTRRKNLVEKLLNHNINEVKDFAQFEVSSFNKSIEKQRKDEETYGIT